jgi:hypothetical protein
MVLPSCPALEHKLVNHVVAPHSLGCIVLRMHNRDHASHSQLHSKQMTSFIYCVKF